MFFLPDASFWRLWARALVCIALACLFLTLHTPAHATAPGLHRHHHHHRYAHNVRRRHDGAGHRHRHRRLSASRGGDAVSIALRYLGRGNPTGTRGPWCGDFVNFVEHLAGRSGVPSRMATAWAAYGHASAPVRGAIAVFPGHVAYVMGQAGGRLRIISGNWSHRVGIGLVSRRSAIAIRTP